MEKIDLIELLKKKGFKDNIINAFEKVERADFVPEEYQKYAYVDGPLPLGKGSTISQPQTIAHMLDWLELEPNQKILEIGSGSGYVLALIKAISPNSQIFGVEINQELVQKSQKILDNDIKVINQNGLLGLLSQAPFDRILVSAAFDEKPMHLIDQLKEGGILVTPVKNTVFKFRKNNDSVAETSCYGFAFVAMQGNK